MAEARIKRWRVNKREQGMKAVTVWLTGEEELRLKDLAVQERCSPSQVIQRTLAQYTPQYSSPTDTSLLREQIMEDLLAASRLQDLIRAEVAAMQGAVSPVSVGTTVGATVAPTVDDTVGPTVTPPAPAYVSAPGHSLLTEPPPPRKSGRKRSPEGEQILDLLAAHPEGLTAEQLRGSLTPSKPLGDTLSGMRRTGVVRTQGVGRALRYFVAR